MYSSRPALMAHLVLGYPDLAASIQTAETYIAAGVQILELQIPFSHPTADGPIITEACQEATRQGVTIEDCLEAMAQIRAKYPEQEIMVMSYLNRVYHYGYAKFAATMAKLGIQHVIIPDLPVDAPLTQQSSDITLVPVLAANVSNSRLDQLLNANHDFFYLMSDFKITGSGFSLHPRLKEIIQRIRQSENGAKRRTGIGFGISTPEQVRLVNQEADVAIVGSALINAQKNGRLSAFLQEVMAA